MAYIDYYKILGLSKGATEKEIKAAYRKLARKYHPDLNPDNKESEVKFQQINEAHEVLSNPESRKKYDKYGENWKHGEQQEQAQQQYQNQYQQQSHQQSGQGDFFNQGYSDFFESMFGGSSSSSGFGRSPKFRGSDLNAEFHLNLADVYTSQKQVLTVNDKKIRLTIPAGVENGQEIKIKGKGSPGVNGGPHGDLYLKFVINNNTRFKREGKHLYSTVDLDLYTAVLGGEITIDTFDSQVKIKVKAETENETKVRLKGKGFPVYKKEGEFGDLIITYRIKIPTRLTDKEKALFKELQNLKSS